VGGGCYAYLQPDGGWGWSNAGLIVDGDACLLVDTLYDLRLTQEMLDRMADAVPAVRAIGTLVNTHANGDHCWGNQLLGGARIIASQSCAEEMLVLPPSLVMSLVDQSRGDDALSRFVTRIFGPFDFEGIALAPPTETFTGHRTLTVGTTEVRLVEVGPAHTRGDIIVHVPAKRVVYTGDILFNDAHPVVWAGPVSNWIRACETIIRMDVDVVVAGHGPIGDKADVAELQEYFEYFQREARARYESGMPAVEAARDISLDRYLSWGEGERVVANVVNLYKEFAADPSPPDVLGLLTQMAELSETQS